MTERYNRGQIEQEIHVLEKHRWITAPNAIRQLLADRDKLVVALAVYRELEEVAETHGFIQLNAGNYTARNALKEVGE